MNRQEIRELLPVINAFAVGRAVQFKDKYRSSWTDTEDFYIYPDCVEYRIKPEAEPKFGGWQPIATAPKDGTVVLTELGSLSYVYPKAGLNSTVIGWYLCAIGSIPTIYDDWVELSPKEPLWWMPMPERP